MLTFSSLFTVVQNLVGVGKYTHSLLTTLLELGVFSPPKIGLYTLLLTKKIHF